MIKIHEGFAILNKNGNRIINTIYDHVKKIRG